MSGTFNTTILKMTRVAHDGRRTTYEAAVTVNGANHMVRVELDSTWPEAYTSVNGFDAAFPYARDALRIIGSIADRIHKGEAIPFPMNLLI